MKDLFGNEVKDEPVSPARGRRGGQRKTGHAAPPGSGPKGESCRTCAHLCRYQRAKTYLKCGKMKRFWTGGGGTDVKAGDPACRYWEPGKDKQEKIYGA